MRNFLFLFSWCFFVVCKCSVESMRWNKIDLHKICKISIKTILLFYHILEFPEVVKKNNIKDQLFVSRRIANKDKINYFSSGSNCFLISSINESNFGSIRFSSLGFISLVYRSVLELFSPSKAARRSSFGFFFFFFFFGVSLEGVLSQIYEIIQIEKIYID